MVKQAFLTKEQVIAQAPAVATKEPSPEVSDRYTFVDSERIIDSMEANGWGVIRVKQPKSRISDPRYRKHQLVFRPRDAKPFTDPRYDAMIINHDRHHLDHALLYPEVKITNSLDRSCRLLGEAGLFALICANGLTINVSGIGDCFEQKHMNFDPEKAYEVVSSFGERLPRVFAAIEEYGKLLLNDEMSSEFASEAARIRFPDSGMENPKELLVPRRDVDSGKDLWTHYNVAQENCMRGGFRVNKRSAREIKGLDQETRINSQLWDLTEKFAEMIRNN